MKKKKKNLWVTGLCPCDALLGYTPSPGRLLLFPEDRPPSLVLIDTSRGAKNAPGPGGSSAEVRSCSQQPNAKLCGVGKTQPTNRPFPAQQSGFWRAASHSGTSPVINPKLGPAPRRPRTCTEGGPAPPSGRAGPGGGGSAEPCPLLGTGGGAEPLSSAELRAPHRPRPPLPGGKCPARTGPLGAGGERSGAVAAPGAPRP